jgi:hypothetical protein
MNERSTVAKSRVFRDFCLLGILGKTVEQPVSLKKAHTLNPL